MSKPKLKPKIKVKSKIKLESDINHKSKEDMPDSKLTLKSKKSLSQRHGRVVVQTKKGEWEWLCCKVCLEFFLFLFTWILRRN